MGRSVVNRTGVASLRGLSRGARRGSIGRRIRSARMGTDAVLSDGVSTMVPGISERTGGVTRHLLEDFLGTVKKLSNSGTLTDSMEFDAFGVLLSRAGTTNTQSGFAGQWGYQSDSESEFQLLGHRYYDPVTGRFLSRDPIRDGRNFYGYCDNNPLKAIDPTGLVSSLHSPQNATLAAELAKDGLSGSRRSVATCIPCRYRSRCSNQQIHWGQRKAATEKAKIVSCVWRHISDERSVLVTR